MKTLLALVLLLLSTTLVHAKATEAPLPTKLSPEMAAKLEAKLSKMQALESRLEPLRAQVAEIFRQAKLDPSTGLRLEDNQVIVGRDRISFEDNSYGVIVRGPAPTPPHVAKTDTTTPPTSPPTAASAPPPTTTAVTASGQVKRPITPKQLQQASNAAKSGNL